MMKLRFSVTVFCVCALTLIAFVPSEVSAQAAVEYGGIISKPPPRSPAILKDSDRIAKPESSRSCVQKRRKSDHAKTDGKTGGPLIIERRGNRYERIQ